MKMLHPKPNSLKRNSFQTKHSKRIGMLSILSLLSLSLCFGQTSVVSGYVYAFKDLALKNIQVSTKKTKTAVQTDSLGEFRIVCGKNDKITFTGNGFKKVVASNRNKDTLKIKMFFIEGPDNEKIAVGYGHVTNESLQYSISHFAVENSEFANYSNIYDLIQSRFSGVSIINGAVVIRGIATLYGDPAALYVVDGVIVSDISFISPKELKSIDIIKDSGAAIYGSRGANGVVIIHTRREGL